MNEILFSKPNIEVQVLTRFKVKAHKDGRLEPTNIPELYFSYDGKSQNSEYKKLLKDLGVQYLYLNRSYDQLERSYADLSDAHMELSIECAKSLKYWNTLPKWKRLVLKLFTK